MGEKNPKPSCLGGVHELDKEIILLHMSIFPSQTDEEIPWDDNKEGPVWWQVGQGEDSRLAVMKAGHASFGPQLPKHQMQILTLVTNDGCQKVVVSSMAIFSFRNGALFPPNKFWSTDF